MDLKKNLSFRFCKYCSWLIQNNKLNLTTVNFTSYFYKLLMSNWHLRY